MKNSKWLFAVPVVVVVVLLSIIGLVHLVHPSWVGEQNINSGYIQKTVGLVTDAPHATTELFYSTVEDAIILVVGFAWGKSKWRKEHEKFDEEHGVEH